MPLITVLGDRDASLPSHRTLDGALERLRARGLDTRWVGTDDAEARALTTDGLWLAPGGPYADTPALHAAIGRALDDGTPILGTCGGFQHLAVVLARRAGVDARHAEEEPDATDPYISPLPCRVDGTRRTVTPVAQTNLSSLLGPEPFGGLFYCGYAPASTLVGARVTAHAEGIGPAALEVPDHPFAVGTLFHVQADAPLSPLIEAFAATAATAAATA